MFKGINWPDMKNSSIMTTKRKPEISKNQKANMPIMLQKSMPMEKAMKSDTTKAPHSHKVGQ